MADPFDVHGDVIPLLVLRSGLGPAVSWRFRMDHSLLSDADFMAGLDMESQHMAMNSKRLATESI